jgi:predicted amidophosphoribosyltransferase
MFYQRNILLVDDVLTTGMTASECAKSLKNAGTNRVFLVALARSKM